MWHNKNMRKLIAFVLAAACLCSLATPAFAASGSSTYIPTTRNTLPAPEKAKIGEADLEDFELLYETNTVRYYYRDDRDIFAVEDKDSGYVMKTGVDLPFSDEAKDAVKDLKKELKKDDAPVDEILAEAKQYTYADDLNTTYLGIANSLITVEYIDGSKTKFISSASEEDAESQLSPVSGTDNQFVLAVNFTELDLQMNVYITLEESSISYFVPSDEFTGAGIELMAAVIITPFLGASGGTMNVVNDELDWEAVPNDRVPGYVLVPDGSGSLIRFVDNTSTFNPYKGDVYGKDYSTEMYYDFTYYDDVPVNDPVMPVFGIAHGEDQMAFVAWADQGAEYLDIVVNPDETKSTTYTWAYPRFEYNTEIYQLYDELGNGFFTTLEEIHDYDIDITYSFLFGDGSGDTPAADYTGMALEYRQHLLDIGELTLLEEVDEDIPIRLDFIMADSESGIIGTNQIVVTTAEDVRDILNEVTENGITNVNSGLIGWQRKGETLSKPYKMSFSGAIGSKGDFQNLFEDFAQQGIDISFSRDVLTVNKEMLNYYNTAIKCASNWYVAVNKAWILPENLPTTTFSYATPAKASEWVTKLTENVAPYSSSFTISGMSSVLTSTYNRHGVVTTLTEAIEMYRNTLENTPDTLKLNLDNPNQYLWKYTDRYLQMPVGNSQYIYETDSVPFLQLVLHGTMEMYAPYSNFSFYTQDCVLRMIDYNISPSFILSHDPSWNLADTYSANLYSTEFTLYEEMIGEIYNQVNGVLGQVQGYEWVNREVPENGVTINTYELGGETRYVIVNYTANAVTYHGVTVAAESAAVAQ